MTIRVVGVCLRPDRPEAAETLRLLLKWLAERGLDVRVDENAASFCELPATAGEELGAAVDLVIALGGDGTLLGVARSLGTRQVPILGVNLGTLGYLTEISVDEMLPALERVLAGQHHIQSRLRIEVSVERGDGARVAIFHALNDAVITTRASRMIDLETRSDGDFVTTYHGDGLIVSTPTGSTGYSLSAGGPILLPGSTVVSLTPICSHTLTQRPLVIHADVVIDVIVRTRGSEVTLTVDGQEELELKDGDRVRVTRSPHPVELIASPFHTRYEILRAKLRWGER